MEGYELNISDYLLKPFSFERFIKAVNKTIASTIKKEKPAVLKTIKTESNTVSFFLKGDKKHHQIDLDDLLYIEAYGNYTKLYLKDEMIVSHEKISHYEAILPDDNFLRIHKSFVIAIDKIKFIEGNRILINENKVPIGQTYKSAVTKLL